MATATKKKPAAKKAAKPSAPKAPKAPKETKAADDTATETKPASRMVGDVEIRKGVPLPPRTRSTAGQSIYKFSALEEEGDSFEIPHGKDADFYANENEFKQAVAEEKRTLSNRLTGAARRFMKANPGVKLAVRATADGVGVWRVAASEQIDNG